VYFEESLKNFKDANEAGYWKNTQINPDDEFGCIFTGVELTIDSIFGGLEIWLGGNVVERINKDIFDIYGLENYVYICSHEHRDELEWESFAICPKRCRDSQLDSIMASFGPMTVNVYETLLQQCQMNIPEFIARHTTSGGRCSGQQQNTVRIDGLYFYTKNIGGSISTALNELGK
jgi:hypothetical protein